MLTVSAAAGLSGLCAGYVTFTRPLLRPAGGVEARPFKASSKDIPSPDSDLASRYLRELGWAADAKYVVHNGKAVLFFNEWKRVDDGKAIELKPFAMLYPPKADQPEDAPLTIAGEAAVLQVEGAIDDITTSDPGRIIGGRMPGMVQLRGPDGLDLLGSDFYFDEKSLKVWSDGEVAFTQGLHSGRGRGVTLELFRVGAPEAFESVAVSGVRTVRLRSDVEMDLRVGDDGGPFGALAGDATKAEVKPEAEKPKEEPLPTRVTCEGMFTFDLETNLVTFEKNVVAQRAAADGAAPDSLQCDTMTVVFEPTTPEGKQAHAERWAKVHAGTLTEDDGFQATDGELSVVRLMASGKNVVFRSPSNELVAHLEELLYDAKTGTTSLKKDVKNGPVTATQGASTLASPEIVIEPVEGGPPRLGCVGQGWMTHQDPPGQIALTARWSKGLQRLRAAGGLDLIRLTGDVQVRQPQESFVLVGDEVELWLDPNENGAAGEAPRPVAMVASGRMEPRTLIAVGNVKLDSPELRANAKRLDVTFVAPAAAPAKTAARRQPRTGLVPASGRIHLVSAEVPTAATASPGRAAGGSAAPVPAGRSAVAPAPAQAAPQQPLELVAEQIAVVAERSPEEPAAEAPAAAGPAARRGGEVREVHTTGGVRVVQRRGAAEEPLYIQGDRLDLFNRGEGKELVQIFGKTTAVAPGAWPAKEDWAYVVDQGSVLWGLNINLDRGANVAWVQGPGSLQLPVKGGAVGLLGSAGDAAEAKAKPTDAGPEKQQRLDVRWQKEMKFDGDKANFYGTVQTQLGNDVMSCEEMEVRLTRRFDFAAADRRTAADSAAQPEIAEVICKDQVNISGQEFDKETGKHIGDRVARFGEFTLDQRTGDTNAQGPGWISIWRKGGGNRAGLTADNAVRANAAIRRDEEDWELTHVRFSGTSKGNIKRRSTTFLGGVEVISGPVMKSGQMIDPDHAERAPDAAGWMTCERLILTQRKREDSDAAYSEVDAQGNVRLDGRGFSGQAEEVMYDESKGQYILKSYGSNVATIAKWSGADGNGSGESSGQVIEFYPASGRARVAKAKGADGLQ